MALSYKLDPISYSIGMINCFIEMVACGVKKLAISPPIEPEDAALYEQASKELSEGFGTKYYFEESLMITDIQSAEFTKGKNSILYYANDSVLEEYLALKKRVEALTAKDAYKGQERKDISIAFGRMLCYPEEIIMKKVCGDVRIDPFFLKNE